MMPDVVTQLKAIQQKIRMAEKKYHRAPGSVSLLAVSKTHPVSLISKLVQENQFDFGENYLQEALEKISALKEKHLKWHFIGKIQSNKCEKLAQNFSWVHTVTRFQEAALLSKYRPPSLAPLNICIQVKLEESATKSGILPNEVAQLIQAVAALPSLRLRGLMTIPTFTQHFDQQVQSFSQLKKLLFTLKACDKKNEPLDTLSMGMTHDLEAAISEGATMVRVGTGLFGERRPT